MNKIIPKDLNERMNIASWDFYRPLSFTDLVVTDIDDHEVSVEVVYKSLLHEVSVVDKCRWRFERTFKTMDFYWV